MTAEDAVHLERLTQALRVMQGLTLFERQYLFDIGVVTLERECGTVHCIAGWCGTDPWFQAQGFVHHGSLMTQTIEYYFGTAKPFYWHYYPGVQEARDVTYDMAVAALKSEIARLEPQQGQLL